MIELRSRLVRQTAPDTPSNETSVRATTAVAAPANLASKRLEHLQAQIDDVSPAGNDESDERPTAVEDAIRLLARRALSRGEIASELAQLGHDRLEIEAAIAECEAALYLDDMALARAQVERLRTTKRLSAMQIRHKLRERRLDDQVIDVAIGELDEAVEEQLLRETARRRAEQLRDLDRRVAERRLIAYLARRGWVGRKRAPRLRRRSKLRRPVTACGFARIFSMISGGEGPTTIAPSKAAFNRDGSPRSYEVRTLGCQMNVHDSERLSGALEAAGYVAVDAQDEPDVVVINTCAVRENASNRLYGNLGQLASVKREHDGMQIAVGGCLAQKDQGVIVEKAPWVDVVFGTHNMGSLPALLERARHNDEAQVEILESLEVFPSTLPTKRDSAASGWVSISVGCNNTCTFCIVPSLRGKEEDRRPGDVLREVKALVDDGAIEVTLLGQNVNTYGVGFGDRLAFGKLLRAMGDIDGLERVRFTSPHPAAFTDDVIAAMAETHNVMPSLHMPLQSGSDSILKSMRRSYRSARFLRILDAVRERIPNAAITTDIIVGFPGESDEDFEDTMRVVEASRFQSAFTFQYSIRPGTPAATMDDQVPKAVVQERYERLLDLQERISLEENQALIGSSVEVLVAAESGKKDGATQRVSGRAEDMRLVHVALPEHLTPPRPGDVVSARITGAAPHFLIADDTSAFRVRETRAGDAWDRRQAESCGAPAANGASQGAGQGAAVNLGMPSLRVR